MFQPLAPQIKERRATACPIANAIALFPVGARHAADRRGGPCPPLCRFGFGRRSKRSAADLSAAAFGSCLAFFEISNFQFQIPFGGNLASRRDEHLAVILDARLPHLLPTENVVVVLSVREP
jgi:hypothetical protein